MRIKLTSVDNPYILKFGGKHIHLTLLEEGLNDLVPNNVSTSYYVHPSRLRQRLWRVGGDGQAFVRRINHMIQYFKQADYSQADIINAHDVVAGNGAKGNLVLTLHGYFARESLNYGYFKDKDRETVYNFAMEVEKEAISKAKAIIAVDTRIKDYLIDQFSYPSEKIFTIYNAVDTVRFSPEPEEGIKEIRSKLGIAEDKFVVLVPRRYVKKNGVLFAAKALKLLNLENIYMIFVGSGPEKENIESELAGDKRAIVMEALSHKEILNYYKMCDVVMVPSIRSDDVEEATSLSMLEGMACGKVVICSNIGGMKEVIVNGSNGILVDEKSPEQIAQAVLKVQEDCNYRNLIGTQAREYVVRNHSHLEHASRFLKVYQTVLEQS